MVLAGVKLVIVGAATIVTFVVVVADAVPTVTFNKPVVVAAATVAFNCVELTNATVAAVVPINTVEAAVKPVPIIVITPPIAAEVGEKLVIVGGTVTVIVNARTPVAPLVSVAIRVKLYTPAIAVFVTVMIRVVALKVIAAVVPVAL